VPASDLERFLSLVRRELGATEAVIVEGRVGEDSPKASELRSALPDGRAVIVRFAGEPTDREAKHRRLEMLVSTFDVVAEDGEHEPRARPPVARSLRDELLALGTRAAALNVFVIDANSPIVWGAAHPEGMAGEPPALSSPHLVEASERVVEADTGEATQKANPAEPDVARLSRRARHWVRGLPGVAALRKGKHLRFVERERPLALLAHSFAGIYVIVLVYGEPFDELRAERALVEAMPRVERLVLALPPLDPTPQDGAGVVAMRRPRRR
jgi:hypothetical protein